MTSQNVTLHVEHEFEGEEGDEQGGIVNVEANITVKVSIEIARITITKAEISPDDAGAMDYRPWKDKAKALHMLTAWLKSREGKADLMESLSEHLMEG